MAGQPIKSGAHIEEFFSTEMSIIFNEINNFYLDEYPNNSISVELFLVSAMGNQDTMLYKCLNGFLNSVVIIGIRDSLLANVKSEMISGVKLNKKASYSPTLSKTLADAYNTYAPLLNDKKLASDMVLLSLLNNNDNVKTLFESHKLTYGIALDNSYKIREDNSHNNVLESLLNALEDDLPDGGPIIVSRGNVEDFLSNGLPENIMNGTKSNKKPKNNSIESYCTDLNAMAERGQIDDLIGRKKEIDLINNILHRRKSNNVVLVGEAGVGKTQIVEGLAKQIVDGISPLALRNSKIVRLNFNEIMSGTQFRGVFEERLTHLVNELKKQQNVILFLDGIHKVLTEKQKNEFDFVGIMSDLFNSGEVKVIATTNYSGFKETIERNSSLNRKFQKVTVDPPSHEECVNILSNIKHIYEQHHCVKYYDDFVKDCVELSTRYITDRSLPTSAIDIMDEAGVSKRLEIMEPLAIKGKSLELHKLNKMKDSYIKNDNAEALKNVEIQINAVKLEMAEIINNIKEEDAQVLIDDLYSTISKHTNIPISKINVSEKKSISKIDEVLKSSIIGQDEAIESITRSIKRSKVGLSPKNKPIGSFLCVGNSGVGKTLMAKQLAKEIYGNEKCLVRFDMSEYADKTSVNKLIGASAGYIGYDQGGLLTEAIKKKKHCVLLIDEIEKANEEIFNLFLQIMDEGFLTDNEGVNVDFKNTIIILTSNAGTKQASMSKALGFDPDENANKRSIIERELKQKFPPEFINRLTDIIYFNQLDDDNLKKIIKLELNKLSLRMKDLNYDFEYNDDVVDYLFNKLEKDKNYGARPILKLIQTEIENKITDIILDNDFETHSFIPTIRENCLIIN